jgi:hypothetical protein
MTGKPQPGFWLVGWGYSAWFSTVSSSAMELPSMDLTTCP